MISLKVGKFTAIIAPNDLGTVTVTIKKKQIEVQQRFFLSQHNAKLWARDALNAPTLN